MQSSEQTRKHLSFPNSSKGPTSIHFEPLGLKNEEEHNNKIQNEEILKVREDNIDIATYKDMKNAILI